MHHEYERNNQRFTTLHIDLPGRVLEVEDRHGTVARLDFSGEFLLVEGSAVQMRSSDPQLPAPALADYIPAESPSAVTSAAVIPAAAAVAEAGAVPEAKEQTITLTGRLRTAPKPGRTDRSGKPTAWARFAAFEEGRDDPHPYLATFHRHTTAVVLGLAAGVQVTVEGYRHLTDDPQRSDTFSVINLVSYPGNPPRHSA